MRTGFETRRIMGFGGIALAASLLGPIGASAGACDAKRAHSLIGRSYSPWLEQKALALSGASTATLLGLGFADTADHRIDRVDLFLDGKGDVVGVSCG